jgi:hypothetical protein
MQPPAGLAALVLAVIPGAGAYADFCAKMILVCADRKQFPQ